MYTCFVLDDLRLERIFSRLTGELLFANDTFIYMAIEQHQTFQATVWNRTFVAGAFIHRIKKNAAFLDCETPIDCCKPAYFSDILFPSSTLT